MSRSDGCKREADSHHQAFADLAAAILEVAAATPPAAKPPMAPKQVEDAADIGQRE
jgi:hypothetical protein